MVGLLDIAPAVEKVKVKSGNVETEVEVYGVSIEGAAHLLGDFPELRKVMTGQEVNLTAADLVTLVPRAAASIIAAGVGKPGDGVTEKQAAALNAEAQLDLIDAILRLTLPRGLGPFVAKLVSMGAAAGVSSAALRRGPASRSPKPPKP